MVFYDLPVSGRMIPVFDLRKIDSFLNSCQMNDWMPVPLCRLHGRSPLSSPMPSLPLLRLPLPWLAPGKKQKAAR